MHDLEGAGADLLMVVEVAFTDNWFIQKETFSNRELAFELFPPYLECMPILALRAG